MQTLNLTLPTCWQELTPAQLRYVFYLLATDKFTAEEIKVYVMFRWIAEVLPFLSWLDRLPTYPVRLPQLCGHSAIAADLSGLSFGDYITCDNLYTGYLLKKDQELLRQIAAILYRAELNRKFVLKPEEYISIFYWFASAKEHFARNFTHFFHTASLAPEADLRKHLQEMVDAQIRALTKGAASPRYGRLARAHRARRPNG